MLQRSLVLSHKYSSLERVSIRLYAIWRIFKTICFRSEHKTLKKMDNRIDFEFLKTYKKSEYTYYDRFCTEFKYHKNHINPGIFTENRVKRKII